VEHILKMLEKERAQLKRKLRGVEAAMENLGGKISKQVRAGRRTMSAAVRAKISRGVRKAREAKLKLQKKVA